MDIELFIIEVQSRPAIWDYKSEEYSKRREKVKAWEEISELFVGNFRNKTAKEKNVAVAKLQRKWKSLRDCFNRENAKIKNVASGSEASGSKQYIYYQQLSFLNCLKEGTPTDMTLEGETNNAETLTPRPQINRISVKRSVDIQENEILETLPKNLKRKHAKIDDKNDPDKQFLMSMLPHVKKIDEFCKLDFQSDMLQLLRKYTHNQNYENYTAQYYEYSGNSNIHTTQNCTTSTQPSSTIQPSPTHSYNSDQSLDTSSVVEHKYRGDDE